MTAIRHQEPDKVPKGEVVEPIVMQRLLGDQYLPPTDLEDEFLNGKWVFEMLHSDLVLIEHYELLPPNVLLDIDARGNRLYRDAWGCESWQAEHGGARRLHKPLFTKPEQVYDYEFPTVKAFNTEKLEKWAKETEFSLAFLVC